MTVNSGSTGKVPRESETVGTSILVVQLEYENEVGGRVVLWLYLNRYFKMSFMWRILWGGLFLIALKMSQTYLRESYRYGIRCPMGEQQGNYKTQKGVKFVKFPLSWIHRLECINILLIPSRTYQDRG